MNMKIFILTIVLLLLLTMSNVNANERITATPYDYFAYYGADTPAGQTHSFAIEVDGNVYYINSQIAEKIASYSYSFRKVYDYDLEKWGNKFTPDAISFGGNGFNAYYTLGNQVDDEFFQFVNDKTFEFEYKTGQKVGYNTNAKVITKIYYPNGAEITETY